MRVMIGRIVGKVGGRGCKRTRKRRSLGEDAAGASGRRLTRRLRVNAGYALCFASSARRSTMIAFEVTSFTSLTCPMLANLLF